MLPGIYTSTDLVVSFLSCYGVAATGDVGREGKEEGMGHGRLSVYTVLISMMCDLGLFVCLVREKITG